MVACPAVGGGLSCFVERVMLDGVGGEAWFGVSGAVSVA